MPTDYQSFAFVVTLAAVVNGLGIASLWSQLPKTRGSKTTIQMGVAFANHIFADFYMN